MAAMGAFEVASLLLSTYAIVQSGEEAKTQADVKAVAEESNAKSRQIERKRNLIRALSEQNVRAGASGFTSGTGSSAQAIQLEDIRREKIDEVIDKGVTSQRAAGFRAAGRSARSSSLISAGAGAASTIGRARRRGSVNKPKSSTPLHDQSSDLGW